MKPDSGEQACQWTALSACMDRLGLLEEIRTWVSFKVNTTVLYYTCFLVWKAQKPFSGFNWPLSRCCYWPFFFLLFENSGPDTELHTRSKWRIGSLFCSSPDCFSFSARPLLPTDTRLLSLTNTYVCLQCTRRLIYTALIHPDSLCFRQVDIPGQSPGDTLL